jgi:hypothetical protein|nr:MAG TPA: hypothetical protein [Caudoviricetes sp.]
MNNHSFVIRTLDDWQNDAINCAGICKDNDLDNGQFVTRGDLGLNTDGGYEFACTLPADNATDLWLVEKPAVGTTVEQQEMSDPRYFYNPKGSAFSIKGLTAGRTFLEVPASAFATGKDPKTVDSATVAFVGTDGRLVADASVPASGTYFTIEAEHTVDIGIEAVPTWILKCARN